MKTRIISFLSAAALLAGCYEDAGELGVDTATRIALSPAEIGFTADGTTVDGKVAYVGVVQVMPFEKGRYTWRAEGDVAWATVGETVVDESFADTWTGAVTTTRMRAVEIMATPNTEYRRSGVLTVTAEDGTVETFPITQAGLKADAEIVCELAETGIEYASAGGETTIDYTTNMGDVYDYSVTYGEPDAGEWLTWSDEGAGRVVLRAAEWTSKSDNRTAVFTIHVGTADTSEASAEIAVVQLRVDDYYYLYGASVPRYEAIDAALQMTKQEEGVYTAETYFAADRDESRAHQQGQPHGLLSLLRAGGGRNGRRDRIGRGAAARRARNRRRRPAHAHGRLQPHDVAVGAHYDAQLPARRSGGRLSDQSLRHTARNLQDVDDAQPRLGWRRRHRCLQIGLPAGFQRDEQGYGRLQLEDRPHVQLPQHGGAQSGVGRHRERRRAGADAAITALGGRHYTFYEYLTGAPRGGLMEEYYSEWPAPYTVGREVRDAADYTILFEGLTSAKLQEYAGREEEFFEEHPVSRIQIQGICPYGWHVANFQDWYDILYAAYDFGSKNNGGYVPKEPSFANTVYGSSSAAYKINVVPYLRISRALWTVGGKCLWDEAGSLYPVNEGSTTKSPAQADIADNSEEFGFNLAPTGWRAMSVGWQDLGLKTHVWIPMPTTATYTGNGHTCYMGWRLVAMTNNGNWIFRDNYQNGNVAHGVRCVKNYDAE